MSINQHLENYVPCDDNDNNKKNLLLNFIEYLDKLNINPDNKPKISKLKKTIVKSDVKDFINVNREFKSEHLSNVDNIPLSLLENYLKNILLKDDKYNKDIDKVTEKCLNFTSIESEILEKHDNTLGLKEIKQLAKRLIYTNQYIKYNEEKYNLYDSPNALIAALEKDGLLIPSDQKGETSYSYSPIFLEKYNKTGLRPLPVDSKSENIPAVKLIHHFDKLKIDIDSSIYTSIINDEVATILNIPCYTINEVTYVKISVLNNALATIFKDKDNEKRKEILEKYFENTENLSKISIGKLYKKLTDVK